VTNLEQTFRSENGHRWTCQRCVRWWQRWAISVPGGGTGWFRCLAAAPGKGWSPDCAARCGLVEDAVLWVRAIPVPGGGDERRLWSCEWGAWVRTFQNAHVIFRWELWVSVVRVLVLKFNTFCVNNVTSFLWPCKFVDLMLNSSVDFRVRDRDEERYFGG
jgi:hypothetical protein